MAAAADSFSVFAGVRMAGSTTADAASAAAAVAAAAAAAKAISCFWLLWRRNERCSTPAAACFSAP